MATKPKRGYSREFPLASGDYRRYLLDKIPPAMWIQIRAKAKRDGISMRTLILRLLAQWMEA